MKTKLMFCLLGLLFQLSAVTAQKNNSRHQQSRVETVPAEYFYEKLGLKINPRLSMKNLIAVSKTSNGLKINDGFKLVRLAGPSTSNRPTVYSVIPAEYKTFNLRQLSTASRKGQPNLSRSKDALVFGSVINWDQVGKIRQIGNTISCASRSCKIRQLGPKDEIAGNGFLIIVPNYTY